MKLKFKVSLSCILISLCCLKAKGQLDSLDELFKSRPYYPSVQLCGGFGIPLGQGFSNSAPEIYYGKFGYTVNVSYFYPIKKSHWGAMVMSSFEMNGFDVSSFYSGEIHSITGNYNASTLLGGAYFSLPVNNSLIDFKILVGPQLFQYPGVIYSQDMIGNPLGWGASNNTWNDSPGNSLLFTYDIGIGLRHLISTKLLLTVNLDICVSAGGIHQNFQDTNNFTGQTTNEVNDGTIRTILFNMYFGLGYRFGK